MHSPPFGPFGWGKTYKQMCVCVCFFFFVGGGIGPPYCCLLKTIKQSVGPSLFGCLNRASLVAAWAERFFLYQILRGMKYVHSAQESGWAGEPQKCCVAFHVFLKAYEAIVKNQNRKTVTKKHATTTFVWAEHSKKNNCIYQNALIQRCWLLIPAPFFEKKKQH